MASSLFLSTISDRYQILSTNQTVHCRCSPTVDILRQISNTISTNQTVDILRQISNSLSTNQIDLIIWKLSNSLCSLQTKLSIYSVNIKLCLFSTNNTADILSQYKTLSVLYKPNSRYTQSISNSLCSLQTKLSIFFDRYQTLSVLYKQYSRYTQSISNSLCSLQTKQSIYSVNIKFSLFSTNQTVDILRQYQILSVLYKPNCRYSRTDVRFSLYKRNCRYSPTDIKFSLFSTNNTVDILRQYQILSVLYEPNSRYFPTDIEFSQSLFYTIQNVDILRQISNSFCFIQIKLSLYGRDLRISDINIK